MMSKSFFTVGGFIVLLLQYILGGGAAAYGDDDVPFYISITKIAENFQIEEFDDENQRFKPKFDLSNDSTRRSRKLLERIENVTKIEEIISDRLCAVWRLGNVAQFKFSGKPSVDIDLKNASLDEYGFAVRGVFKQQTSSKCYVQ